ncbi:hypothetical protein [Nonomuraea diastatica]|uniref:hypothetical protein n=1 Tax=Nonomuraea diastatica TaxID=1848329 RepID=UPI003CCC8D77
MIIQTEQLLALGVPEDRIYIDRGFSGTTRSNRGGLDHGAGRSPRAASCPRRTRCPTPARPPPPPGAAG